MTSRHILLVVPSFHGYGNSIAGALRRSGHDVTVHQYDSNTHLSDKLRTKMFHELPSRLGSNFGIQARGRVLTERAVAAVCDSGPDVVVTVKGDALGSAYWESVDASGARQLLWLYDELARMTLDDGVLDTRPSIVSYSPHDVAALRKRGLRVGHVLDAFDHTIPFVPLPSDEIVFVGARYPDRTRILTGLHERGVPVRAFGRDWSRHPLDRLRTWEVRRPEVPSSRDVDRATAYGITAGAVVRSTRTQIRTASRCAPTSCPAPGRCSSSTDPTSTQLYEPGREVLVFSGLDELVELCKRARADRAWARAIADRGRVRTLAEHTFDHRVPVLESAWD